MACSAFFLLGTQPYMLGTQRASGRGNTRDFKQCDDDWAGGNGYINRAWF